LCGARCFDICVIGGGVTGLSTAYHLKRLAPELRVAVLEAQVVGFGASGRNAGQLIVHFGGGDLLAQVRKFGAANVGAAWTYVQQGVEFIRDLQMAEGLRFDFQEIGYLQASLEVDGGKELERYRGFLEAIGQLSGMSDVTAEQMKHEFDGPYFGDALFDPRGGQFNPLKLVRGLRAAAETRGAEIFENSPVTGIEAGKTEILVKTHSGLVRCAKLVLATNAYTHRLPGLRRLAIHRLQNPLMVYAGVTEPLTPDQWSAVRWPRRCGVNVVSDLFFSFAPTSDGRVLYVIGYYAAAPRGAALGPDVSVDFERDGPGLLASFFPALREVRTSRTWGGPISATADFIPQVGVTGDPRIAYAVGCWGHGMPIGARNGRTLAELSLERRTESTEAWFVQRKKSLWPAAGLAPLVSAGAVELRRQAYQRIAKAMTPPLTFSA
jgi:glycine/D-amino acid oxidase-like deaminating enzyme